MSKYIVITTPSDSRSDVIKKMVEEQGLKDIIEFIDFREAIMLGIIDKIKGEACPGNIVDTKTWKEVSIHDFISAN